MTASIGGFFELELPRGGGPLHVRAAAFANGRAGLRCILETKRPSRAWVPFYICDAALQSFAVAGVPVAFYPIDDRLDPRLPAPAPEAGECLLYVNYFGVKTERAARLVEAYGDRVIVDDTQAFFATGYQGAASFNSARKFFGVPDGGYVYGDGIDGMAYPRLPDVRYEHLINRLIGRERVAFEQFRESEATMTAALYRMSSLSERLLAAVDYDWVRTRRLANFRTLHDAFGARNRLTLSMPGGGEVPYCYPLLADTAVPWDELWAERLFVPRLWKELPARPQAPHFPRELELADRLLPLPIDHRYDDADLGRLAAAVARIMRW